MTRHTALITGASAGIGKELARCFAADGYDLILTARREDRLTALAEELAADHDVEAHTLAADLGAEDAPQKLFADTERRGWTVDALVNNAGFGMTGDLADSDPAHTLAMIQLNVTALTALTHLFLPKMLERGHGHILNLGSTAGFQPGPGMTVYYASKAYVQLFSEGLREEVKDRGVNVSVLCPGATASEFAEVAGNSDSRLFAAGVMDAAAVARAGFEGMKNGRDVIVPGLKNKATVFSVRLAPRPVTRKLAKLLNESK